MRKNNWMWTWVPLTCLVLNEAGSEISINAYTTAINTFNATAASKADLKQTPEIGIRFSPGNRWGLDFALGGGMQSGTVDDSAAHTVYVPSTYVFNAELGIFYKLIEVDKAYLGMSLAGGLSAQRWVEVDQKKPAVNYPGAADYSVWVPYGLLNLEPGYFFNDHFSLYSKIGLNLVHVPNSNYIDTADADYNSATRSYPLKSRNDNYTYGSVSSLGLGVRFYF